MASRKKTEPGLFVILGGTGDLSRRKLLPALCRVAERGELSGCHVVGLSRDPLGDETFRQVAHDALTEAGFSETSVTAFAKRLHAHSIGAGKADDYRSLAERLSAIEHEQGLPGNRVFYLALPPSAVRATVAGLDGAGLSKSAGWTRLIVEKPFGHDLESAVMLNRLLHEHFAESQIYRIDHYLGK
jgi:glucose-6-phosphate 1-dehydrogenase